MKISIDQEEYPWRVIVDDKTDAMLHEFENRCYEWLDANVPETEWVGAERCRYTKRRPPLYIGDFTYHIYFKTEHDALMFKLAFE